MYIIHTAVADSDSSVATAALRDDEGTLGERVEFNPETGKAHVQKDVGEQACEYYSDIVPASSAEDETDEDESED